MNERTKPALVVVPEGATALDVLAERYRAAFDKMQGGREQWIEGTLELAAVVAEARKDVPDHRSFSQWLGRNGLHQLHPNERTALIGFNRDPAAARKMLAESNSLSWRVIWETRPNKEKCTPTKIGKGAPRTDRGPKRTGHGQRKRARIIPDVMRDDPVRSTPPPRIGPLSEVLLTREQVDPDFKGDTLEWVSKYGHVNTQTKGQRERSKQQDALQAWIGKLQAFETAGRMMLGALSAVDQNAISEWQSKNGKAEKLRLWCSSIEVAYDAVRQRCVRK